MTHAPIYYTAAQIAKTVGVSKRTLLARLQAEGINPSGTLLVSYNPTPAWTIDQLPEQYRDELTRLVKDCGTRDIAHLVNTAKEPWQPKDALTGRIIPLAEIHPTVIHKAEQRRNALRPSISRRNDLTTTTEEKEAIGLREFRETFGNKITARGFRGLLKRVIERDNFAENWNRLEIYIDDNPRRIGSASVVAAAALRFDFRKLNDCMARFHTVIDPSPEERAGLWEAAIAWFNERIEDGDDAKDARIALVNFLYQSSPWLSVSKNALRVAFQNKLDRKEAGKSLSDGRHKKRGIPTAEPYPEEEIEFAVFHAAFNCGGRVSQAVREIRADELGIESELAGMLLGAQSAGQSVRIQPKTNAGTPDTAKSLAPAARETIPALSQANDLSPRGIKPAVTTEEIAA